MLDFLRLLDTSFQKNVKVIFFSLKKTSIVYVTAVCARVLLLLVSDIATTARAAKRHDSGAHGHSDGETAQWSAVVDSSGTHRDLAPVPVSD